MKHSTLDRFKKLMEEGHEIEFDYKGEHYSLCDYGDSVYIYDKQYKFNGLPHNEMVEAFVKTAIFPDGNSIESGEADIDVTWTSNCVD